jgi:hypothetical protein
MVIKEVNKMRDLINATTPINHYSAWENLIAGDNIYYVIGDAFDSETITNAGPFSRVRPPIVS